MKRASPSGQKKEDIATVRTGYKTILKATAPESRNLFSSPTLRRGRLRFNCNAFVDGMDAPGRFNPDCSYARNGRPLHAMRSSDVEPWYASCCQNGDVCRNCHGGVPYDSIPPADGGWRTPASRRRFHTSRNGVGGRWHACDYCSGNLDCNDGRDMAE